MITHEQIKETLELEFKNNWLTTDISWPNAPIDLTSDEDEFVRFSIVWFGSTNVTFGTTNTRKSGQIGIQIFVKRDVGSKKATRYADQIAAIFENKQFGQIFTYAADLTEVGEGIRRIKDVEYGYYQLNLSVPFEAE